MATEETLKAQGLWCYALDIPAGSVAHHREWAERLHTGLELAPSAPRVYPDNYLNEVKSCG